MEEKTEKPDRTDNTDKGDRVDKGGDRGGGKRHGRKRHFSGKPRDKQKDQKPQGGKSEEKDGAGKNSGGKNPSQKGGAAKNAAQKNPQDNKKDPKGAKRQGSEEKSEKYKREPEETIFDFTWGDAWGLYGVGYHIVIKDNKERMYLSWSVDLKYGEMKMGNRLQEFLEDIKNCGLQKWDGRRYTKPGILDGDTWSVKVNSLVIKAESQGTNEYPEEWKNFLGCLHEKWGVPVSKREQWE